MSTKGTVSREYVLGRMEALCSKNEKCSFDIHQKLLNYSLHENDREWIIKKLKDDKFIDDKRFAGFFVKDKYRFNKWGKIKIRHALYGKKIDEAVIDEALDELDTQEYKNLLLELIRTKNKLLKDRDTFIRKGKLFRFASQKGFETELIYTAIEQILEGG